MLITGAAVAQRRVGHPMTRGSAVRISHVKVCSGKALLNPTLLLLGLAAPCMAEVYWCMNVNVGQLRVWRKALSVRFHDLARLCGLTITKR